MRATIGFSTSSLQVAAIDASMEVHSGLLEFTMRDPDKTQYVGKM